jgi:hypothetical protein
MSKPTSPSSVSADPEQWSEKSKQSVAYGFVREYTDILYKCWHCQTDCVFAALDQKHTFEVKKASIDQRRILCQACWAESNRIRTTLRECEAQWATCKPQLLPDKAFLGRWSDLLIALEAYVPGRADTAKKNMLAKLLSHS